MAVRAGELSSDHQMILDNILEFIEDQGRTVTYKWLSRELKIHVNLSKQLLHCFLTKYRKEHGSGLAASFILAGLLKDQTSHKVCIANESDIEKVKSSFSVITSNHVYSVQKCPLKDSSSLYITELENWEGSHEHKFSGIKAAKKIKVVTEEVIATQPSISAAIQSSADIEPKKDVENVKNPPPKPSGAAFNKNGTNKSNVLATMFKNQETKPKKISQNEEKPIKEDVEVTEPKKSNSDEKEKTSSNKSQEVKRNGSMKGKNKISLKKKTSVTVGKRRRIIEDSSSSEDSSSESEEEEEDPIPANQETPMDVDEAIEDEDPITSYQPTEKYEDENKNSNSEPGMIQLYKRVDETYIDDQGYMNTRKVMQLVQEPDLTNKAAEKIKPKEPVINSKGKKSTKNTANQPTLMNFFKRA